MTIEHLGITLARCPTDWMVFKQSHFPSVNVDPPICDLIGNICFNQVVQSANLQDCQCNPDCRKTTLSIFESSKPIELDLAYCYVLAELHQSLLKKFHLHHAYNNILRDLPKLDPQNFCLHLMRNDTAIIKIELVAGSVIRSVKDQRFTFEGQLSSLGKIWVSYYLSRQSLADMSFTFPHK